MAVSLFSACGENEGAFSPEEERMINLIMDMHVAEAAMGKVPDKYKDSLRLTYRSEIARLHGLEAYELDSLLLDVQDDPALYQQLTREAMMRMDSIERSMH